MGLPIPAAAAMVAAVVYASGAEPLEWWPLSVAWLGLLLLLGFLMVSTWRYYSFKGINLSKPYTPLLIVALGGFIYGVWNYSEPVLLMMAAALCGQRHRDSARRDRRRGDSDMELTVHTIALVGSDTLLGREVRDIVGDLGSGAAA